MEEIKVTKSKFSKYLELLKSIMISSDNANSYSEESQANEINESIEISQDVKDELNKSLAFINGNIEKQIEDDSKKEKFNVKKVKIDSVKAVYDAQRKIEDIEKEEEQKENEKN